MSLFRQWRIIAGSLLVLVALAHLAAMVYTYQNPPVLRLAAGSLKSESYILGQAIRDVLWAERRLKIVLVDTAGSSQSMSELTAGQVDCILTQADTDPSPSARLIARMFPEDFQLLVRNASITDFSGLRGLRVGLAPSGSGQHASFWFVARHYGLSKTDLTEVNGADADLDEQFLKGSIDAIFRVRPPQNLAINRLVREGHGQIVPMDQGAALVLQQPALETTVIPRGAYQGAGPVVPAQDLPTVSAPRLLLASKSTDPELIRQLTAGLFELRHELVKETPLASFISPPREDLPSYVPLHEGARRYYDREKPNLLQENADYLSFLLTVLLGTASWLWGLKRQMDKARKNRADEHNLELTQLMEQAASAENLDEIRLIRGHLIRIFQKVVSELDADRLDEESVNSFALVWNATAHVARDRATELLRK